MTSRDIAFGVWTLLGACVVACQVAAGLSGGRLKGLLALLRRWSASKVGQGLLVLGWMWLGWHAFAR